MVCCFTEQQAQGVRERLVIWLAERGLSLNQDKTRIVCLTQGFDFLGFSLRRYPSHKLLIKPSRAAIGKHRERLAKEMRRLRGSNAGAVIATLNPVIRGWTAYYRGVVSAKVFSALEHYTWQLTYKWARNAHHRNKPTTWLVARYFGKFCPSRDDKWVFGDKETGAYLVKHNWTRIRRHVMVKGGASPDDPSLAGYWRYRRDKHGDPLDSGTSLLLARQGNRCPRCGDLLLDASRWPSSPQAWGDWWLGVTRSRLQDDGTGNATLTLIHTPCHRASQARQRRNTALQPATP